MRITSVIIKYSYYLLSYAENLPFKDEVFDKVLIGVCLGHISNKEKALKESARVLKSKGLLVVYDQITYLDKILGRDRAIMKYKPKNLNLIEFRYLFHSHVYIAMPFSRKASALVLSLASPRTRREEPEDPQNLNNYPFNTSPSHSSPSTSTILIQCY